MRLLRDIAHIGRLAVPLALGSISQAVNELVDRAFLGNYSESALAAVVPGGMISAVFCAFLSCTIGYSGAVISRRLGAGDRTGAVAALAQGVWLTALALPLVLLADPLGEGVLALSGHAPELLQFETVYFRYAMAAGAIGILTTVLIGYLSAQKRTSLVCAALAAGSGLNILADWTLVPSLGIVGAGIGLLAASLLSSGILLFFCLYDDDLKSSSRTDWRPDRTLSANIVRHGLPFGVSAIVGAGSYTVYLLCLGKLGAGVLAAANAVFAIHGLVYFVVCAIESAVLVLVGRSYGQNDTDGMRRHTHAGILLASGTILIFYLLILPFSELALGRFSPAESSEFLKYGKIFLLSMALRDVFEALQRVYTGALRAVGRTRPILTTHVISSLFVWLPLFVTTTGLKWPLATWQTMTVACFFQALLLNRAWKATLGPKESTKVWVTHSPRARTPRGNW